MASGGRLVAVVTPPSLTGGVDNDLWAYWGNLDAATQEDPAGVWDADFLRVYPGVDAPNSGASDARSDVRDSTGNSTAVKVEASAGVHPKQAQDPAGWPTIRTRQTVPVVATNLGHVTCGQIDLRDLPGLTVQAVGMSSLFNSSNNIAASSTAGTVARFVLRLNGTGSASPNRVQWIVRAADAQVSLIASDIPVSAFTHYRVACTYDATEGSKVRVNGVLSTDTAAAQGTLHPTLQTEPLLLGSTPNIGDQLLQGDVGMVLISGVRRPEAWLDLWDAALADPVGFYTFGDVEDFGEFAGAVYSTNFSGYVTGSAPSDWTARFVTGDVVYSVEADASAIGGTVLRAVRTTSSGRSLLSWDAIDVDVDRADVEVLCRVRSDSTTASATRGGALVRGSGAAAAETGYTISLRTDLDVGTTRSAKFVAGTATTLVDTNQEILPDTWYWMRFRVTGTDLRVKRWAGAFGDEPGAWTHETTDPDISDAGWVGAYHFAVQTIEWDYFAVGTGGLAAPGPGLEAGTLTLDGIDLAGADLSWTTATGAAGTVSEQLERSPTGEGDWSEVAGATGSPHADTTVTPGASYDWRVRYTDSG
jgi:hypothetical protein